MAEENDTNTGASEVPRDFPRVIFDARDNEQKPPAARGRVTASGRRGVGCAVVFALLFVVWPLLAWLAGVWIDYLWFAELGQTKVWITRVAWPVLVAAGFSAVTFGLLFANLRVARAMAPRAVGSIPQGGLPPQVGAFLSQAREQFSPWLDRLVLWGSLAIAFFNGLGMSGQWLRMRVAVAGAQFPYADPQFGKNVGFFVFQYPALRVIADWLMGALVLTAILSLVVHLLDGAINPWARLKGFAPHVKAHLSVLMAFIVLAWGFNYWLDIFGLNFSTRGQAVGASYTDVHAQLPAYRILIVLSIATAIALLLNIRFKGWRLPLGALGVWVGASILVGGVWPALMQQFVVSPNEAALEAPYIERNIEMTRRAYGLDKVRGLEFPARENLAAADVLADRATLKNVRLWDPPIADKVYGQLQSLRPYYEFPDVDVDRYVVDGVRKQVLVGAREMNSSLLPDQAQTWVNRHLVYTHGYGLVMSPVSDADTRGLPKMIIGDVPPRTSTGLKTEQGRIYFGERATDYVVVDTGIKEFDYPLGEKNAEYEYKGKAGIAVGSLGRRLAWAAHLGTAQILFSEYVKPDSKVVIRRDLTTRLNELAPFLQFEDDPYPVLVKGRVMWVVDAYTRSKRFPYSVSLPGSDVNYLRNSVKVVVDAYDGTTTFYAFDPEDPVLQAWRKVFPTLFVDGSAIPAEIREHFRYPQGLFAAQAEIYRNYHMTDPRVFYNKEDSWEIPGERQNRTMEPFYVLMKLPGEKAEHFYIMQPYTPRNRDNMIGWVAANSDPDLYGQRTVYLFPKERVVLGPEQVKAQINQDPAISPQLSLWNQRGSSVIFGNMIVIPIKDSIVYIQPLFLQAEQTAIPQLTRVVVVYADKVAMENTLEGALLKIFGAESLAEKPAGETTGTPGPGASGSTKADAALAARLYREAIAAQKAGDWAAYGSKITELGKVLERLASLETTAAK